MAACYQVRLNLTQVGVSAGTGRLELATRCATVPDAEAAEVAAEAMQATGALAPWLQLVTIPGLTLAWPTLEEQAAHIRSLHRQSPPEQRRRTPCRQGRGFHRHRRAPPFLS